MPFCQKGHAAHDQEALAQAQQKRAIKAAEKAANKKDMGALMSFLSRARNVLLSPFKRTSASDQYKVVSTVDASAKGSKKCTIRPKTHKACRSRDEHSLTAYQSNAAKLKPDEVVYRAYVPDERVSWSVAWPEYAPVDYTSDKLLEPRPVWADVADPLEISTWNAVDGLTDRRSHMGAYELVDGVPRNPVGRTGIRSRGTLGKWGVNHAADPVVTRWKRNDAGHKQRHADTKRPILQFVAIQRLDTGEWAIPGGMCDPGEKISTTLKREFMEEATDCLGSNVDKRKHMEDHLAAFFEGGNEIYRGYVDDPRNTDNAWMETIAYNFHDEDHSVFNKFPLAAGDDAGKVKWMDLSSNLKLYASHKDFVKIASDRHKAHW